MKTCKLVIGKNDHDVDVVDVTVNGETHTITPAPEWATDAARGANESHADVERRGETPA